MEILVDIYLYFFKIMAHVTPSYLGISLTPVCTGTDKCYQCIIAAMLTCIKQGVVLSIHSLWGACNLAQGIAAHMH